MALRDSVAELALRGSRGLLSAKSDEVPIEEGSLSILFISSSFEERTVHFVGVLFSPNCPVSYVFLSFGALSFELLKKLQLSLSS